MARRRKNYISKILLFGDTTREIVYHSSKCPENYNLDIFQGVAVTLRETTTRRNPKAVSMLVLEKTMLKIASTLRGNPDWRSALPKMGNFRLSWRCCQRYGSSLTWRFVVIFSDAVAVEGEGTEFPRNAGKSVITLCHNPEDLNPQIQISFFSICLSSNLFLCSVT